jgi:VanZ family protein
MTHNWWPVGFWMSVIFLFSTDLFSGAHTSSLLGPLLSSLFPAITADQIDALHFALRKLGHWSEYFILAGLLLGTLRKDFPRQTRIARWAWCVLLTTLYAASDEWHQSFVPSRTASLADVAIDTFGAICGALCFSRRAANESTSRKLVANQEKTELVNKT